MGRTDSGTFVCEARNAFGMAKLNSRVLVEEVPDPPFDVKAIEVGSRGITVRWSHPHTGNLPISKYVVQWKREKGELHFRCLLCAVRCLRRRFYDHHMK